MVRPRTANLQHMRRPLVAALIAVTVLLGTTLASADGHRAAATADGPPSRDWTALVDPFIGTSAPGFVLPAAAAPFGMVQAGPSTRVATSPFSYTGYLYTDPVMRGFPLVHQSGPGVPMGGNLPFMPLTGPVPSTDPQRYAVPFSRATETASPGSYGVTLGNGVDVDIAASTRGALLRSSFPPGAPATVLAAPGLSNTGVSPSSVRVVGADRLEGSVTEADNRGGPFTVFFAALFDRAITSTETFVGAARTPGGRAAEGVDAGALLGFPAGSTVTMRVAVSYVSVDGARKALEQELPSFDVAELAERTKQQWQRELDRVRIGDVAPAQDQKVFYTSLYRAFLHPNVFDDVDGRYRGTDQQVHQGPGPGRTYENFSLWDTIRGENALLATLQPERYVDMVRSLATQAEQSGAWPRWSLHQSTPNFMSGDPAVATVADAACRGLLAKAEVRRLYRSLQTLTDEQRDPDYLSQGYVPREKASKAASDTLENAHADASMAMLADRLGDKDGVSRYTDRATRGWQSLLDPATKYLRPRNGDGSFPPTYDPASDEGWKEGNGHQYQWLVPHDVGALVEGLGGRDAVRSRLDDFFSYEATAAAPGAVPRAHSTITVFGVQYKGVNHAPGNEHDLQVPYYYNWVGQPWKTQAVMRSVQALFTPTPDGMPGNDDLGSLTGWYVWAALGLQPNTYGSPVLNVGSPLFGAASLEVPGGRFLIEAPGASVAGKYVQSARLDGEPLDQAWLDGSALRAGGSARFVMGERPSSWAADAPAPPSLTADGVAAFGCGTTP